MTYKDQSRLYSRDIGHYEITPDGKRALLDEREARIRSLEEIGFMKAEANRRAYYLAHDWDGRIFLTEDPTGMAIVRVCPYLEKKD